MKEKKSGLRLNIPRTILVGLAFFTVTMFWQVYDSIMPLFLLDFKFGAAKRGIIMALDNILAVALLPFMGILSDRFPMKWRSKVGRRIPFIVLGSILAAVCFMLVNMAHNMRNLVLMLVLTSFVLVFMCLYRTPAVSLMPDVTPKPIRSNANAVINIMGTVGGVISLLLMNLLQYEERPHWETGELTRFLKADSNNWLLISLICAFMVLAAIVMVFKVKENKFVEDSVNKMKELGINPSDDEETPKKKESVIKVLGTLTRPQLVSLIFILLSVFLWYMAYNSLTTHFSVFATQVLKEKTFTLPLLIANAAAFVMFLPSVEIGKRLGRKKTVMIGVGMMILGLALATAFIIPKNADIAMLKVVMYPTFILIGGGWATINVHSFVMCVELSDEKTTGAYTGLYYAFTMTAQIITPIISGFVMDGIGDVYLIPYALVFVSLAMITMLFVRHGNAQKLESKEEKIEENKEPVEG